MTGPTGNVVLFPVEQQVENMLRDAVRTSASGGGGGNSGGLDVKVAVLETHVESLRKDVADTKANLERVRLQLATLTQRVARLPSKGYALTVALAAIAAFSTFQQQIQRFVHPMP